MARRESKGGDDTAAGILASVNQEDIAKATQIVCLAMLVVIFGGVVSGRLLPLAVAWPILHYLRAVHGREHPSSGG